MSLPGHVTGEMRELPFGEHGVDAFLDGKVVLGDAPPGFEDVARLVHAAKAPATAGELAGQDHVVATLAAAVGGSASVSSPIHEGRRPVLTKLLTAKMATAVAVTILGGGAAAAATGSLPTSLQSTVSHGLSSVGISVPNPSAHAAGPAGVASPGTTTVQGTVSITTKPTTKPTTPPTIPPTQAIGPSATGPALYGLCTAYAASSGSHASSHSVAFRNLSAASTAKGESVAQYCTGVTPSAPAPSTTGASHVPATVGPPSGTPSASGRANSHAPATPGPPSGTPGASGTRGGRPSTSSGSAG